MLIGLIYVTWRGRSKTSDFTDTSVWLCSSWRHNLFTLQLFLRLFVIWAVLRGHCMYHTNCHVLVNDSSDFNLRCLWILGCCCRLSSMSCRVSWLERGVRRVDILCWRILLWVKFSKETDFTKILQNRSPFCPKTSKTVSWLLWGARKKIRRPRAATRTPGYVHLLV